MIKVEGYKAFNGIMRIVPSGLGFSALEIDGNWLYKPDTKCWYGKGSSYPEEICEIVLDRSV